MPNSIRENNNDVRAFVATHDIQDALDVGPGEGTYHMLLGDLIPEIDGVEIWYKNIVDFSLKNRYRDVWNDDIRGFEYIMNYDLIIFGDVLEHMSVVEAITVFLEAKKHAKWVLVSVPMVHFPQDEIDGNTHEIHMIEDPQEDLIPELGRPRYYWTYITTGTFIYEGLLKEDDSDD